MFRQGHHTLVTGLGGTVEQAKGYENGKYEGDNLRGLVCYRFNYDNRVVLQLSADKDPTEAWGKNNFYGYSLTLNDFGRVRKLVIGRYNLQFGQGVSLWTGFEPFSLIGDSPVRYAKGIKAASPFYEEGWQEGLATTLTLFAFEEGIAGGGKEAFSLKCNSLLFEKENTPCKCNT